MTTDSNNYFYSRSSLKSSNARINSYFDALKIGHTGNRVKVLYGKAASMSTEELNRALKIWENYTQCSLRHLEAMHAPAIIIDSQKTLLTTGQAVTILKKFLKQRQSD